MNANANFKLTVPDVDFLQSCSWVIIDSKETELESRNTVPMKIPGLIENVELSQSTKIERTYYVITRLNIWATDPSLRWIKYTQLAQLVIRNERDRLTGADTLQEVKRV